MGHPEDLSTIGKNLSTMGNSIEPLVINQQSAVKEGGGRGYAYHNYMAAQELYIELKISGESEPIHLVSERFKVTDPTVRAWRAKYKWDDSLHQLEREERNKFISRIATDRANEKFKEYEENKKIQRTLKDSAIFVLNEFVKGLKDNNLPPVKTIIDFKILAEMLHTLTGKPSQITETHNGDIVEQEVRHSKEVRDILEKVILHKSN